MTYEVYVAEIRESGYIKVGTTVSVPRRMDQLGADLIVAVPGGRAEEQAVLQRLRGYGWTPVEGREFFDRMARSTAEAEVVALTEDGEQITRRASDFAATTAERWAPTFQIMADIGPMLVNTVEDFRRIVITQALVDFHIDREAIDSYLDATVSAAAQWGRDFEQAVAS